METKFVIDREITTDELGNISISKTNFKPFTGGALKLAASFGYLTAWEVLCIQTFVRGLPLSAMVVNIGAGAGSSGLAMAEARQDLIPSIYTVDIKEDGGALGGLVSERNAFAQYNTQLVNQVLGDSAEIGEAWGDPVDLVFIDGNHSAEGVERDINAWLPHVKPGGYILCHDYGHDQWAGVKPTVERLMAEHELLMVIDYLAVYRVRQPIKKGRKPNAKK